MQLREIIKPILHPRMAVIMVLTPLSGAALILTFTLAGGETPLGYFSYALSAYAMTVLIINMEDMYKKTRALMRGSKTWHGAEAFLNSHTYSRRYITDISYRVKVSLWFSLAMNVLYAVSKLAAGVYYASFWYGADAIYYIVLSVARILLIRHMHNEERDIEKEYRIYRLCGVLLFVLNAALTGVVHQIINQNMGYKYPGLLIYMVTLFAFINTATAVVSAIRFRKLNSPLLSAVKAINLAKAMVVMFALQTAMFASFGESGGATERTMNIIFGSGLCIFIFGLAVYMVVRANINLRLDDSG